MGYTITMEKPSFEQPERIPANPNELDVVLCDGRWAQVRACGLYFLDTDEYDETPLEKYDLVKHIGFVVDLVNDMGEYAIPEDEIKKLHWDSENKTRDFQGMVTVYGEITRRGK